LIRHALFRRITCKRLIRLADFGWFHEPLPDWCNSPTGNY
jgi:hypothetical protein